MEWLGRGLNKAYAAVDGLKALGSALIVLVLGLADFTDVVPIRPVLEHYFGAEQVGVFFMFAAVFIAMLRFTQSGQDKGARSKFEELKDSEPAESDTREPF